METPITLKPCPFCGVIPTPITSTITKELIVKCDTQECPLNDSQWWDIEVWNTRPASNVKVAEIEEALGKITQGEWHVTERKAEYEDIVTFCVDTREPDSNILTEVCTSEAFNEQIEKARIDFNFIAKMPEYAHTLLDELQRVEGERDNKHGLLESCQQWLNAASNENVDLETKIESLQAKVKELTEKLGWAEDNAGELQQCYDEMLPIIKPPSCCY